MKDKNFERELKTIIYLIREYGIKNIDIKTRDGIGKAISGKHIDKETYKGFIIEVHNGFFKAQKLIVYNLQKLSLEKKKIRAELKQNARDTKLINNLKLVEYQTKVFKRLSDSILWQILMQDDTKIRRLYHGHPDIDITNANIDYDIEVIESIFLQNPMMFPLLSDITNANQVGDVLIFDYENGSVYIMELKDGKVNDEIKRILDQFTINKCEAQLAYELADRNEHFTKHFTRYLKQLDKLNNTVKTINDGEGFDYFSNLNVKISEVELEVNYYHDVISEMFKDLKSKNYSVRVIDECLLIGVYSHNPILLDEGFETWKKMSSIDFPTIDYRSSFFEPTAFPLLLFNFSNEDILKIITGEYTIKMTIDIDKMLRKFCSDELSYKWLTKKETSRINSQSSKSKIFTHRGQGIAISYNDEISYVAGGVFIKLFYRFIKPQSLFEGFKINFSGDNSNFT